MEMKVHGITYQLSKEELSKAITYWLLVIHNQKDVVVDDITPEFKQEYYYINNFEESYRDVFDGVKVLCNSKQTTEGEPS